MAVCTNITVNLNVNGLVFITAAQVDGGSYDNCGPVTLAIDQTLFGCGDIGPNPVTLMVTDQCGNTNSCTAIVTVRDIIPPVVTCPANVTVNADPGQCYGAVALGTSTASDNCGVLSVVSFAPSSFRGQFPVGTNFVTWTATDVSGNSASCTQLVVVVDNQPPIITCPPDVTVSNPVGMSCAIDVALGAPVVNDNCGVASTTNNAPSSFSLGTNLVVWTATDVHGNSATCTQQVMVLTVPVDSGSVKIVSIEAIGNDINLTWQTFGSTTNVIQLDNSIADGNFTNSFTDIATVLVPGTGTVITNWVDIGGATNFPSRYYRIHVELGASPCPP